MRTILYLVSDLTSKVLDFIFQSLDHIQYRIGEIGLVKIPCILHFFPGLFDYMPRYADNCRILRHIIKHYGVRPYFRVLMDPDVAQHFRARGDKHVIIHIRMPFLFFFTRTAERYSLVYRYVIAYPACFTDYRTHAVVYEKSSADLGSGMNFNARDKTAHL